MRKRIGYCKIGRSIDFTPTKWGFQGDAEAPQLLYRLARRNPDVEWVVVGRNSKQKDLGPNITNPWSARPTGSAFGFADRLAVVMGTLDGVVVHAGQTGTSHSSIPFSDSTWAEYYAEPERCATTPQDWAYTYAGFLLRGLNILGDRTNGRAPVVWICGDPRNYLKARDLKWPTGCDDILSQYQFTRVQRHERFQDLRQPHTIGEHFASWCQSLRSDELWEATHTYRYGGLELMILPDDWETWGLTDFTERLPVGVASTSFAAVYHNEPRRSELIRDFVLASYPDAEVYGKWDAESLRDVPMGTVRLNEPHEFPTLLGRWRVTVATPALGTSWTVAKPLQCWAARTVCLMIDRLDDQGWVLPARREGPDTREVGRVNGRPFYSVRDDWTPRDLQLAAWVRIETPVEFKQHADTIANDRTTWAWLVDAQRDLLRRRWNEAYVEKEIERKLGLT